MQRMDCNREEADRVRALAEEKLALQDYMSAKKYALKAQQLFPGLQNMVQIMAVIDVHMAALVKIAGCNELDWYAILQVEPNADEATIKKQYRKLALSLHPDKNKFAGAESAFKLIGEASQVLSDKSRRLVYNAKRGLAQKRANPLAPSRNQRANSKPNQENGHNVAPRQPAHLQPFTFWTACPFCHMRYQYLRKFEDKNLLCHTCRKPFIAINLQKVNPTQVPSSRMGQPKHPTAGVNGFASGCHNATYPNNSEGVASAAKAGTGNATHLQNGVKAAQREEPEKELHSKAYEFLKSMELEKERAKQKKEQARHTNVTSGGAGLINANNAEEKERQRREEQSQKSELSQRIEEMRRSIELQKDLERQRQQLRNICVTDKSKAMPEMEVRAEPRKQEHKEVPSKAEEKEHQQRAEQSQKAEMSQRIEELRRSIELQKNLERQKEQLTNVCVADKSRAMPEMDACAELRKQEHKEAPSKAKKKQGKKYHDSSSCCSSSSETEEEDENWKEAAAKWKTEGQPEAKWKAEGQPRRSSRSRRDVTYDCDDSDDDFQHVPSSKKAKVNVVGSQEEGSKGLDTPQKLANLAKRTIRVKLNLGNTDEDRTQAHIQEGRDPGPLENGLKSRGPKGEVSVSSYTIPDAEFFNFDKGREEKDVEVGQVWALYDDKDGLPRYYMKVKDVCSYSPFKLTVGWFELRKPSEEICELLEAGCSFTCGEFRMSSSQVMHNVNSFSHLVKWERVGKSMIKVYPKKGEIWCLYEDWEEGQQLLKVSASPSRYCIVEVVTDCSEVSGVTATLLRKVEGFKALYESANGRVLEIPFLQIMRFSHQLPAYKLTGNEAPNVPKDCWELDPAAVPLILIQPAS